MPSKIKQLIKELENAGKEYSGKFLLRPGKELHKAIAIRALQEDESLNNFCLKALKKEIFHSNRSNWLTKGST